jgi:autotransporter-associated beta strand protein
VEVRQGTLQFGNDDQNLGTGTLTLGVNGGNGAVTALTTDNSNRSFANPILLATGHTGPITILMTEDNPASPGNVNSKTFTGGITGNNSFTILNNGGNDTLTFSTGSINNVGAITHTGTGTGVTTINSVIGTNVTGVTQNSATSKMVLTGTNTYTGDTTVSAGILAVDGDAIPNTGNLVINGGKVDPSGATEIVASLFFGAVQQAAGTWGSTSSTATNKNDTYFTGTGVINVVPFVAPSGFANWQSANSTAGGFGDDHDNDGVDNGVEWFLSGNANTSGFTALPAVTNTDGTFSVTWTKSADYPGTYGTDFRVETSATLANPWTPATVGVGPGFVEITGNDVKFTFAAGVKDFARLVVTKP